MGKSIGNLFRLFFVVSFITILFPPNISAQEISSIRVVGFAEGRDRFPLTSNSGGPPHVYLHTSQIYLKLTSKSNFGQDGIVPCEVKFSPPFSTIETESLVNPDGSLKQEVFFAGVSLYELSSEEIAELLKFLNAGGILYLNGGVFEDPWFGHGYEYNALFEAMGLEDRFLDQRIYATSVNQSLNPEMITPLTYGPFGEVGQIAYSSYFVFEQADLNGVVRDSTGSHYIVNESQFGKGYVVVAGGPFYVNGLINDQDNYRYYLNLFGLACKLKTDTSVVLDIPSFKQGLTPFDGVDPSWENEEYDHGNELALDCGRTIGQCGCAMTSATMVMSDFGINKSPDELIINPQTVNIDFTRRHDETGSKYLTFGYSFGNVRWNQVATYSLLAQNQNPSQKKLDFPPREAYDPTKLKEYLDSGKPVILKVFGPYGPHWVTVKGYLGDEFIINDPATPDPPFGTYATLSSLGYTPATSGLNMLHYEEANTDYSYLEFVSRAPVQILVTDAFGRRTGYDSVLDQEFEEIPDSYYVFDEFYGDPTGVNPQSSGGVYTLFIKNPDEGEYQVEVSSGEVVDDVIGIYSANSMGEENILEKEVLFEDTLPKEYVLDYDLASGESEFVESLAVGIDIRPLISRNRIYPTTRAIFPIVIYANVDISTSQIDRSTITFGKTGDEDSLFVCLGPLVDMNRDRLKDLLCFFRSDKTGFEEGDKEGILKAETFAGQTVEGRDSVEIIIPRRR